MGEQEKMLTNAINLPPAKSSPNSLPMPGVIVQHQRPRPAVVPTGGQRLHRACATVAKMTRHASRLNERCS
jgi:hypothetical protein